MPLTQQGGRTQHVVINKRDGGKFHTRVKSKELRENERALENYIMLWKRKFIPIDGPFRSRLIFATSLLEKHRAKGVRFAMKATAPDLDNTAKTLMDVLARCEIFTNDARCCWTEQIKVFGPREGVGIEIIPLTEDDIASAREWYRSFDDCK